MIGMLGAYLFEVGGGVAVDTEHKGRCSDKSGTDQNDMIMYLGYGA